MTLLSMNISQNYFNEPLAAQNPITGGCVISDLGLTLPVVLTSSIPDKRLKVIVNFTTTGITISKPLYAGDALYTETQITSATTSSAPQNSAPQGAFGTIDAEAKA